MIRQYPADRFPKLVYADWLEEHGRGDEAEVLRTQWMVSPYHPLTQRKEYQEWLKEFRERYRDYVLKQGKK